MNLLLDTAAFLWLCAGTEQLSSAAASALADQANTVSVSAVTAWEIGLKAARGKLKLPAPVETWFPAMIQHHRLDLLAIEAATAIASTRLPAVHADPFDRLLVATACERGLWLITPDTLIAKYPNVQTLW
jgi:PIN domain nuclease of toxin-antitoxin system